jgi:RNA polymerase sigma-70 factor (ECF subfamily)
MSAAGMLTTTTSLTLLEDLRAGAGERAWREFFRRYSPLLMAFAKRLGLSDADAQDAVQETLLAVHQVFRAMTEPFDRSKGRFKSWLCGVAKNKVYDLQRRKFRRERIEGVQSSERFEEMAAEADSGMDDLFEQEWRRNQLWICLDAAAKETDPAVYQAFELYAVHGQKPEQVAALLGVTRNAVYISKCKVLRRVKALLAELREVEG